jgi:ribose transport system permease protein
VYAFSGFCAAVGSVLYSGRLMQGRPTMGATMLLDIMAATVIGGTSLFGGKGKVTWTLYGVLFYTILATSLQQLKLDNFTIDIVKGFIILAAATLDAVRSSLRKTSTTAPAPDGKKVADHA